MPSNRLTLFILVALVLGIISGYVVFSFFNSASAAFADTTSLLPTIFLRLIKMIIAPLVISTLIVGIAKISDLATLGRVFAKAIGWFLFASLISLVLGALLVNVLEPGKVMHLTAPVAQSTAGAASGIETSSMSVESFIAHLIPTSIADAMARNEILQIVVFSIFFGVGITVLGERARALVDVLDAIAHVMLKVTGFVMLFAPLAVFGALASTVAKNGLDILRVYGIFMGEFYLGLVILWSILVGLGALVIGPPVLRLIRRVRGAILLAFSTASSEAAYPKTL